MITIVSSTNRQEAITYQIASHYQQLLEAEGAASQILDLSTLPTDFVFSALYENAGKNEAFNRFRQVMKDSQKYVFIIPEYNGSFPGVLKAFIDGMEYPNTFRFKKCALVGLSSGNQGGGLALSHLTDIFNYCGMHVLAQKPRLARIEANMDEQYRFTNASYVKMLADQARLLVAF